MLLYEPITSVILHNDCKIIKINPFYSINQIIMKKLAIGNKTGKKNYY